MSYELQWLIDLVTEPLFWVGLVITFWLFIVAQATWSERG